MTPSQTFDSFISSIGNTTPLEPRDVGAVQAEVEAFTALWPNIGAALAANVDGLDATADDPLDGGAFATGSIKAATLLSKQRVNRDDMIAFLTRHVSGSDYGLYGSGSTQATANAAAIGAGSGLVISRYPTYSLVKDGNWRATHGPYETSPYRPTDEIIIVTLLGAGTAIGSSRQFTLTQ